MSTNEKVINFESCNFQHSPVFKHIHSSQKFEVIKKENLFKKNYLFYSTFLINSERTFGRELAINVEHFFIPCDG